jgi:hypothetical protein
MTFPYKIEIGILDFIKTGRFDYVKIGQSKEWILNNFPDPDDIGMGDTISNAKIWFYGNIELHFEKNELCLIFCENIARLDGGAHLKLNKWILDDTNSLTLLNFIEKLNIERIDFSKTTEKYDFEYVRLNILSSNVQLTFTDEENNSKNPNKFMLSAFRL